MFEAHFIEGSAGRLFVTVRRPESAQSIPAVLVCPAFGDEMNKTRRMLAVLGDRLAASNVALVNPDLYGTGDSEGNFRDASWAQWLKDLDATLEWSRSRGLAVTSLVGIRTGAILAAQLTTGNLKVRSTVFWQPVLDGRTFLNQFLRIRVVSNSVQKGIRESVDQLLGQIHSGQFIRIAGYDLGARIARPLSEASLPALVGDRLGEVTSIEVRRTGVDSPHSRSSIGALAVDAVSLSGEPYWTSVESVCDERVIDASHRALCAAV